MSNLFGSEAPSIPSAMSMFMSNSTKPQKQIPQSQWSLLLLLPTVKSLLVQTSQDLIEQNVSVIKAVLEKSLANSENLDSPLSQEEEIEFQSILQLAPHTQIGKAVCKLSNMLSYFTEDDLHAAYEQALNEKALNSPDFQLSPELKDAATKHFLTLYRACQNCKDYMTLYNAHTQIIQIQGHLDALL